MAASQIDLLVELVLDDRQEIDTGHHQGVSVGVLLRLVLPLADIGDQARRDGFGLVEIDRQELPVQIQLVVRQRNVVEESGQVGEVHQVLHGLLDGLRDGAVHPDGEVQAVFPAGDLSGLLLQFQDFRGQGGGLLRGLRHALDHLIEFLVGDDLRKRLLHLIDHLPDQITQQLPDRPLDHRLERTDDRLPDRLLERGPVGHEDIVREGLHFGGVGFRPAAYGLALRVDFLAGGISAADQFREAFLHRIPEHREESVQVGRNHRLDMIGDDGKVSRRIQRGERIVQAFAGEQKVHL